MRATETDISTGSEIERWTRQKRERERENDTCTCRFVMNVEAELASAEL